jgi:hypothetical protein
MFLVNTPSTKAEGECHSSIFYGLVENEKMNEWCVTTISSSAENKGGSKQECVNLEALIFDFTYDQSLKNMEVAFFFEWRFEHCGVVVVCNVVENKCGLRFVTWARVITTTTIMTMRPLPKKIIYQTKIWQLFVTIGMLDEFYQTLISLLSFFNPSHTIFNIQFAIRFHYIVNYLR